MTDPLSITGAIGAAGDVWHFLTFLRGVAGTNIIAAHFKWDATRIEGSEKIVVHKHRNEDKPAVFWYEVEAFDDYTFLRFPVVESCAYELVGQVQGQTNPDARYWRWVAPVRQGVIVGGDEPPNLMVDFVIVGYRPKALIKYFTAAA